MRLIVAEKPSVARDIAKVLGCKQKVDGAMRGDNDIVTWAVGHLVTLCDPEDMDNKFLEWKMSDLPIIPDQFQLKIIDRSENQFNIIKTYMLDPEVDSIVCATDAGREGELIFRYIYKHAGCTKPVERLWISSLTFGAIKSGFENLKSNTEYDNLYESARCRSEADWLIGINGSRAFSIANDLPGLSIGRVMSPTLSILVDRELERRNFSPEKYCELVGQFDGFDGKMLNPVEDKDKDRWSRFPMDDKSELDRIAKNRPVAATISTVEIKYIEMPPQQLYDLTSLQRDANRLYKYSSKRTLDAAQSLYEKYKAITYPRTDSRYLSSDIKATFGKRLDGLCIGEWKEIVEIAKSSERDLFGRFILNKGVTDHHAIIPTGEAKDIDKWSGVERRIYDLITGRFIGMFLPDAVLQKQMIKTTTENGDFISRGEKLIEAGWTAVDKSRRYSEIALPELQEGDIVAIKNMRVRTDNTEPPAPHTEASLLNVMEHAGEYEENNLENAQKNEYGIGTPATRAATIEKLIDKNMVVRRGRALIPTEYGIALVGILPKYLRSTEMTGEWEAKLERISQGTEDATKFMEDIRTMTRELVENAKEQGDKGIKKAQVVGKCPICGNDVKDYPTGYYCENKECDFRRIWKVKKGSYPTLESEAMKQLLNKGKVITEKGTYSISRYEPFIKFERAEKPKPNFDKLKELIEEYGLKPVNKVPKGGSLWFEGGWKDEQMMDFASDCSEIGCDLSFAKAPKALGKKSGWYLKPDDKYMDEFKKAFPEATPKIVAKQETSSTVPEDIMNLVINSGFEYVDKTGRSGSLWIIATEEEAKDLIAQCRSKGYDFKFTKKGGNATNHRPGWYSK